MILRIIGLVAAVLLGLVIWFFIKTRPLSIEEFRKDLSDGVQ